VSVSANNAILRKSNKRTVRFGIKNDVNKVRSRDRIRTNVKDLIW